MVTKRNGTTEILDFSKLEAVVRFASEGLDVDVVEVLKNAKLQLTDEIPTTKLHKILVNSAADLITENEPDYQYLSARLALYNVRKEAFGKFTPPHFKDHIHRMVNLEKYGDHFLDFSEGELNQLNDALDHDRDNDFSYAAVGQLVDKYLVRSRLKNEESTFFESPQFMYMGIGCTLIQEKDCVDREDYIEKIIKFYNGASTFKFSLPTPIMAGARTPTKQFSSCVVLKTDDNLNSINATSTAVVNYVSKKAGIGIDIGKIRPEGSGIRGSEVVHTGVLPFIKYFTAALKSCSQGGIRGGASTLYYPVWHKEFFNLIVLKNSRGIEENRERRVDYSIQINGDMIRRLILDDYIYLFSPKDFEEMYECYFSDQDRFSELYQKAIVLAKAGLVDHEKHKATDVWNAMLNERMDTGRIYLTFVDNINSQSPFSETIYQSNLCLEIALPTKGFKSVNDEDGRIALCTLASFNLGAFEDPSEMEEWADILVLALDGLLSYQDYPMIQAKRFTDEYRSLGIGIVNLAHLFAKNEVKYGSPAALELTDKWFEHLNYYLTKASVNLAKISGRCDKSDSLCYKDGVFPFELAKDNVKNLLPSNDLRMDWESLREDVKKHGIRNATLMAVAPTESSAQVLNACNGVEMPRSKVSIKSSKSGMLKQVVPDTDLSYEYLWDNKRPTDYLKTMVVIQKWVDQSISTNTFYNPHKYLEGKVDRKDVIEDIVLFYSLGGKTLYYNNVPDTDGSEDEVCDTCRV